MAWSLTNSTERIRKHLSEMGSIEVEPLVREANLEELLTETRCRDIAGTHIYLDVSNFTALASQDVDGDDYKRLIQSLHLYQREVGRIVGQTFDSVRVHFQGPKLHALCYRPIRKDEELAKRALLMQLVLKDFVASVFNPAFPKLGNFTVAGGADLGEAVGTRNGMPKDRELLFLGASANYAAKIIVGANVLRVTETLYEALPEDLQDICTLCDNGTYQVSSLTCCELDELLEKHGIEWDRQESADNLEDDKRQFPLSRIEYSNAEALIDLDVLSVFNNKRVLGASIFADVSGFSRYIDAAQGLDQEAAVLRVFHAIRREMAQVVREDYGALRIQYQGDRLQGLVHLPKDNAAEIAMQAVEIAAALQASFEYAIKACLPEAQPLHLAIGIDMGRTLVSKLGTRAHRDRICLGNAVQCAATCEERIGGEEIGITKTIYDLLPGDVRKLFTWRAGAGCYVAENLRTDTLDSIRRGREYDCDKPVVIGTTPGGSTTIKPPTVATPICSIIVPSRSHAWNCPEIGGLDQ